MPKTKKLVHLYSERMARYVARAVVEYDGEEPPETILAERYGAGTRVFKLHSHDEEPFTYIETTSQRFNYYDLIP